MTKTEFLLIANRVATGEASEQEYKIYLTYYNAFQVKESAWDGISDEEKSSIKNLLSERIDQHIRPRILSLWPRLRLAAAVMALVIGTWLFTTNERMSVPEKPGISSASIKPGMNKAILTMASGKKFDLTALEKGASLKLENISITKRNDGSLIYSILPHRKSQEVSYNNISTPRGGHIEINLPDGSHVFLNTASDMKIPSDLVENRRVELLEGEAFFEIAHNKHKPFRVISPNQTIEVLGTKFNVNAYAEENVIKTTLQEGLVRVGNNIINPGQQAINSSGHIIVQSVDPEEAIAWMRGDFFFDGNSFESTMNMISRWYDVEIVYDYKPSGLHLSGQISRARSITEVLERLQELENVRFKIEGRRIRVIK
ncbi:FecR domain-containing protein [Pedobacter sp. MC2016-14]|uniref:FecR family protein n=1 Tax=Pedobacter sp. MC2016-14 TaxID=2897327 RepID=UPI001E5030F4|nr:FecR domain-containing protein [Pedobacter sp. MC2016-14]MCD0486700.1 FecR domain-containing protein [Pedobacter sp. MC2016-14]